MNLAVSKTANLEAKGGESACFRILGSMPNAFFLVFFVLRPNSRPGHTVILRRRVNTLFGRTSLFSVSNSDALLPFNSLDVFFFATVKRRCVRP